MRRLYYAVIAFVTILRGKGHLFVDDNVKSIVATRTKFIQFRNEVTEMVNDNINQSSLIHEVREVLK